MWQKWTTGYIQAKISWSSNEHPQDWRSDYSRSETLGLCSPIWKPQPWWFEALEMGLDWINLCCESKIDNRLQGLQTKKMIQNILLIIFMLVACWGDDIWYILCSRKYILNIHLTTTKSKIEKKRIGFNSGFFNIKVDTGLQPINSKC